VSVVRPATASASVTALLRVRSASQLMAVTASRVEPTVEST